jgi:uncharacterized protein involved in outer membrane biogenesis
MRKKILVAVGILVAIPIVLVAAVAIFINPIVRAGVEKGGSAALKVPVHLNRASIRWSGHATLGGFQAGNPAGFTEPKSLAFDRIDVAVGPADLFKDVVHIGEITIVKPDLTLEFSGTKNNLSALMDNVSGGQKAPEPETPAHKASGKKFLIHRLRVDEGTVHFKSDLLPGGAKAVTLPSIQLENVGTAEGGATMAQILQTLLEALTGAALKAGQGILPAGLLDNLQSGIRELPARSAQEIQKMEDELKKQAEEKAKELDPKSLRDRLKKKSAD